MSERVDIDFLSDIILRHKMQSSVTWRSLARQLRGLSEGLRGKYPGVAWKSIAGMRDRLIHHYFGVNVDIVWGIVTGELPELELRIQEIFKEEQGGGSCDV